MIRTSIAAAVALLALNASAAMTKAEETTFLKERFSQLQNGPHPRFLKGSDVAGIKHAAQNAVERKGGLTNMTRVFSPGGAFSTETFSKEDANGKSLLKDFQQAALGTNMLHFVEATAEAAFAYQVNPANPALLREVEKRIDMFGDPILARQCKEGKALPTDGEISGSNYYRRDYVWYFALAYDLAYDGLSPAYRKKIVEVINSCVELAGVPTLRNFNKVSYSNTDSNSLAKFAAALLLVRGDPNLSADALAILEPASIAYITSLPVFGGPDGGYANSSAYSLYDTASYAPVWDVFDRVLGYSPYTQKDYVKFLPQFLFFTLPPGSPAGAFGDYAELPMAEDRGRLMRALFNRYFSDITRWFVKQEREIDPTLAPKGDTARLDFLLSPSENTTAPALPSPYLGYYFPSVGVTAFHSDLTRKDRLTVLFRSSPYGSVNHAHKDQNSFVIYNKGKILASDSGVTADYGHAHRLNWAKKTKAHNAITYTDANGVSGVGQEISNDAYGRETETGKIVNYNNGGALGPSLSTATQVKYDIVTGDATAAYGTANVGKALRTLVYVRPSTIVVIDQLQHTTGRKWEYNLHTVVKPELTSTNAANNEALVNVDGVTMCVKVRSPHAITRADPLENYPGDAVPPAPTKETPKHWWSKYVYNDGSKEGLFVSVFRMDCADAPPVGEENVTFSSGTNGSNVTVKLPTAQVLLTNGVVTVK
ncbi:MAG TPA: heparinase II/III family protein [Telluria sp.]|jgi:hypothetical protein